MAISNGVWPLNLSVESFVLCEIVPSTGVSTFRGLPCSSAVYGPCSSSAAGACSSSSRSWPWPTPPPDPPFRLRAQRGKAVFRTEMQAPEVHPAPTSVATWPQVAPPCSLYRCCLYCCSSMPLSPLRLPVAAELCLILHAHYFACLVQYRLFSRVTTGAGW
jgi:hypothetical protein